MRVELLDIDNEGLRQTADFYKLKLKDMENQVEQC